MRKFTVNSLCRIICGSFRKRDEWSVRPILLPALPLLTAAILACTPSISASGEPITVARANAVTAAPDITRGADDSLTSRTYMNRAGSLELLAIRSAELALQRSSNEKLRSLAEHTLREHRGLSAQLAYAGRRLNVFPPAVLLPEHERMLLDLAHSSDFNTTYMAQRRTVAASAYRLHRDYSRVGSSPTLRPVSARAAEVYRAEMGRLHHK